MNNNMMDDCVPHPCHCCSSLEGEVKRATEEVVAAAAAADGAEAAAARSNGKPRRLSRAELKRMQVGRFYDFEMRLDLIR